MAVFAVPEKKIFGEERSFFGEGGNNIKEAPSCEDKATQTDPIPSNLFSISGNRTITLITDRPSSDSVTKQIKDKSLLENGEFNFIYKTQMVISITSSIFSIFKSDLCKPFAIVKDFYSMFVSAYDLSNSDFTSIKSVSLNLFYLVESIVKFAGTILVYPIRIGVVLVEDICSSIDRSIHIIKCMNKQSKGRDFQELLFICFKIAKDVLCIVGLVYGSWELTLASVAVSCIIGGVKSYHCLQKGKYLDCLDNVLGCVVDIRDVQEDPPIFFHSYVPPNLVA